MKTKDSIQTLLAVLLAMMIALPSFVSGVQAQSIQPWSEPINLSKSGAASNPSMVTDSQGVLHAFWMDEFEGYQYAESLDGITWTDPVTVIVPFNKSVFPPVFKNDAFGRVHIFWINEKNALLYAQASETKLGIPGTWLVSASMDAPVYDFDAAVDAAGTVHVSYIKNPQPPSPDLAGVYYTRLLNQGAFWQTKKLLYESAYFRSIDAASAHVRIVASDDPADESVYSVWDDRSQKRIFMAVSRNAGEDWDAIREVIAPDPALGFQTPFGSDISILDNKLLLTWRLGEPGVRCALYSRASSDGGESWDQPFRFLTESAQCPERTEFISVDPKYSVMLMMAQGDLSMIAWNGSAWSNLEAQTGSGSILNPATFEPVELSCQTVVPFGHKLFVIGCDEEGNDIWFISRELDPLQDLFPLPSAWALESTVIKGPQKITFVSLVADAIGNLHVLWVRSAASETDSFKPRFEYARWDGKEWSEPAPVITELGGLPIRPSLTIDPQQRLLLTWINAGTGDLLFSWANSDRANIPLEWATPIVLPSRSGVNDSPTMVVDASGRIVVAYAVAINEDRGIYVTQSTDLGATWLPAQQAFDAVEAGWDRIDQPKLTYTDDGALHLLFSQYSGRTDEASTKLYYSQSVDGGTSWSAPQVVSSNPVIWSSIVSVTQQALHRFWQEKNKAITSTYHQVSTDGGNTWNAPIKISSIDTLTSEPSIQTDWMGNVHLLQNSFDEFEYLNEWLWSGARWDLVEAKMIFLPEQESVSKVSAGVTANGQLIALFQSESINQASEPEREVTSLARSLNLSETPPPFTSLITAPVATAMIVETPALPVDSTGTSPLAGLEDDAPVINRNTVGLVLVILVVLILLVTVLPSRKK